MKEKVNSIGADLLVASSGNTEALKKDPESAQSAVFSAVAVVGVMTNVSQAARDAALEIGRAREWFFVGLMSAAALLKDAAWSPRIEGWLQVFGVN